MKVSELREMLNKAAPDHDDWNVVVVTKEPSIGPTSVVPIKTAGWGFDWNSRKLMLWPEKDLIRKKINLIRCLEAVDIDPGIRSGRPVLKGTRVTIAQILAELADEGSIDSLAEDMDLDKDMLKKLLDGLAAAFDQQFAIPL